MATRWVPKTCTCVLTYEADDTAPLGVLALSAEPCKEHAGITDPAELLGICVEECRQEGRARAKVRELIPTQLVGWKVDGEGTVEPVVEKAEIAIAFTAERAIQVEVSGEKVDPVLAATVKAAAELAAKDTTFAITDGTKIYGLDVVVKPAGVSELIGRT